MPTRREFLKVMGAGAGALALSQFGGSMVEASPQLEREKIPSRVLGFYLPFHIVPNDVAMRKFEALVLSAGANTIVVDIKNEAGLINIEFKHPLKSTAKQSWAEDYGRLNQFLAWADKNKVLVVGRQVVMKDARLVWAHPDLAVHTADGRVWHGDGAYWSNPFDERVVEYNAAVAEAMAALGIKVVQFDYVRLPADGAVSTIRHTMPNTRDNRINAITAFFAAAKPLVNQHGSLLLADFFGYTAWPDYYKDMGIGQSIEAAGPYLDGISPMAYPSLYGSGLREEVCGVKKCLPPTAYPYEVVYYTVKHALELLHKVNPNALVMPWIQAYPDGRYGKRMGLAQFEAQQRGAFDAGATGVVAWNPSLQYHPEFYQTMAGEE